ncbi:hypothetical protein [Clostridium felsineum]|uniref:Uncharacterized protein n=1 Tax=Clostridium felsineum TaxID=36839 RepID=A0A1S8LWU7_9CLOT|nr:hypothetical protein [Clostridium felsineum]MCR3761489.1 hypothetical protein [Clostridium felsineum]URZ03314.1 hypothetical protein CLAUR_033600 [Clostridium felsineum]URZ08352.1 hypothetical protein CLROS_037340 [Clostridium felsineum]URZ13383.1 hypothetical protein CROST_041490 [Clostridium felsineum]URZ14640.1 hypothetical protein CLFE_006370 [Clostridium felsineum DSM 794]
MRVFTLEDINIKKCDGIKGEILRRHVKYSWNEPANCITIANHGNSGNIYIVYGIKINLYDKIETLDIFAGEDSCRVCSNKESIFNLDYVYENDIDTFLQIKENVSGKNGVFNILEKDAFLILPGGCIIIKLPKEVLSLEIDMNFKKDPIK